MAHIMKICEFVNENKSVSDSELKNFIKNHSKAFNYFVELCKDEENYPEVDDVIDAMRSLGTNGEITDEEYDFLLVNFDDVWSYYTKNKNLFETGKGGLNEGYMGTENLFDCDTFRMELSSRTYCCKFKGEKVENLIDTNRYIFGKTVDKFTGDDWEITWDMDVNTGIIKGWDSGEVEIYFKVVDGGKYSLLKNGKVIVEKVDYVPFCLQIDEEGYGDYVMITVEKNGHVKGWDEKRKMQMVGYFTDCEEPISAY